MKHSYYFLISQEQIQVLKAAGLKKRVLSEADIIQTRDSSDEQISNHLKAWIKQKHLNVRAAQFSLVIPRSNVILRQLILPSHIDSEIKSMVELQIVKHIPYDRAEVELDFQILEKTGDGYTKVVVVVVPQETAMRYWNIFAKAGITLERMTISSVGLWLLYKTLDNLPGQLGAIIDFENDQSEICLCRKEAWVNSREIPFGLEKMIKNGYEEFTKQWHLTFEHKPGSSAAHADVVVLAQSVRLPQAVTEELSKALQSPLKVINVDELITSIKNAGNKSWASLTGVALSLQKPPIDVVPQEVRQAAMRRTWQKEMLLTGIAFVCAAIVLAGALSLNWIKGRAYLDDINVLIKEKKAKANKIQEEMKEIQGVEDVYKNRFILSHWVDTIAKMLPKSINLINVNVAEGNVVSIQGTSTVSADVNFLQNKMVNSSLFSNVSLDFVNKRVTQDGEVNYFKITAVFGLQPSGQAPKGRQ